MNEISIRIFLGPWGGEFNPSPIVSVGNVVGSIVPTAPLLVKEDKSWMIKTDEWKAVYSCHSKERCFNSDSYMQLLVCVIIPKGKRLAGEKSPLDLLEDVRSQFDQLFTIDLDATLLPKADVDAAFGQLLSGYEMEKCPWYVFNMEGNKPASFCVENRAQLNALMRFNAYPALAHVERLELGFRCKTTVDINTRGQSNGGKKEPEKDAEEPVVEENPVPRPIGYEVFVDGESTNVFLHSRNDSYIVRKNTTEDYKYDSLTFSLGELLDREPEIKRNQNGTVVVKLDKSNRRIDCTMSPIPKVYRLIVKYTEDSDHEAINLVKKGLLDKDITIMVAGSEWTNLKPSQAKAAIKGNLFNISPNEMDGYKFSIAKVVVDEFSEEVLLTLKAAKLEADKTEGGPNRKEGWSKWKYLIGGALIGFVVGILVHPIAESISVERDTFLDFSAYQNADASNDTTLWKNYLEQYSAPKFKHPVESHLSRIEEKLNQARQEAAEVAKAEAEAYNKCIDETKSLDERIEACDAYIKAEYSNHKAEVVQLKSNLERQQSDGVIAQAEIKAFKAVEWAKNEDYPKNYEACQNYKKGNYGHQEHSTKVDGYIQEIENGRKDIMELLNDKNLEGFKKRYGSIYYSNDRWRKYITREECYAVEIILDYHNVKIQKIADNRNIVLVRRDIGNYLKEIGFSDGNMKFGDWRKVMKVKREIDQIIAKYR